MPQERAGTEALRQGSKPRNPVLCHFYPHFPLHFQSGYNLSEALPYNQHEILGQKHLLIRRLPIPQATSFPTLALCFSAKWIPLRNTARDPGEVNSGTHLT